MRKPEPALTQGSTPLQLELGNMITPAPHK
jgi:hypothetical protein